MIRLVSSPGYQCPSIHKFFIYSWLHSSQVLKYVWLDYARDTIALFRRAKQHFHLKKAQMPDVVDPRSK